MAGVSASFLSWLAASTAFASNNHMRTVTLPLPAFGFIVSTRAALAAGVALFVADRIPVERRRAVGLSLIAFGAATTVPAIKWLLRSRRQLAAQRAGVHQESRLIGATRFPRRGDEII